MVSIHNFSDPAIRSQVDLFSLPPTDTTIDFSLYAQYKPIVNVRVSNSKIEFRIVGNSSQYLDLADCFLYLTVQVVNLDGSDLHQNQNISTTNLFLHSLFVQIDLSINGKLIWTSNNVYPYKSYIETILTFGEDYFESQGQCALFYKDTNKFVSNDTNSGYKHRRLMIKASKILELIDKLRFDLSEQDRYILNDTDVLISLTRSSDAFALCGADTVETVGNISLPGTGKVLILDADLFVRKQVPYPSIVLAHQRLLEAGKTAKYFFIESQVKYFTIPSGNESAVEQNLFMSSIPRRIVLGFVSGMLNFNHNDNNNIFTYVSFYSLYYFVSLINLLKTVLFFSKILQWKLRTFSILLSSLLCFKSRINC